MSAELIGTLSVGVALGALILAGRRDTAQRLADMDRRLARVEGLGLSGRAGQLGSTAGD